MYDASASPSYFTQATINVIVIVLGWPFPPGCPTSNMITDLLYSLHFVYMFVFSFSFSPFLHVLYVVSTSRLCCVMRDLALGALVPELFQKEGYGNTSSLTTLRTFPLDYG